MGEREGARIMGCMVVEACMGDGRGIVGIYSVMDRLDRSCQFSV